MAASRQRPNEPSRDPARSGPLAPAVTLETSSPRQRETPAGALAPGDCLAGRFLIEKELGEGGSSKVFVARDRRLDRPVAIKVLKQAPDEDAIARFAQEARAAGALDHPNVLVVHDVGVERGAPFIVSELLRGHTLRTRLAKGRLPVREALGLALQLARGLAATHARGIVHRDLKPENLFLLEDGRLKILDFGLAKLRPSDQAETLAKIGTVSGAILGTVPYMSPEQVRGRPADARADVFAFGGILQEMLSGAPPFAGQSALDIGHAILNADPGPLPDGTPPPVVALVRRCLAKHPDHRFQSARDLVPVLETLAPPTVQRPPAWWRATIAIAAVVTLFIAGGVARRYFVPSPPPQAVETGPRRLAVLPFRAVSANADGEALCAGLAEIVTNRLHQIEQFHGSLHVISAADIASEHVASARDARNAFGATMAVSGSIQWSGEKILIAANLVDTATQVVVEARDFETSREDIAGLGRLLVQKVAEMLELELRPGPQGGSGEVPAVPPAASALYLQGRGYLQRYDRVENLDRALAAFDGVLKEDPAFALAHAGKAEAWLRRNRIIRDPAALPQARASSQRALELGPNLAQVNLTAALVNLAGGEHAKAIDSLRRVLQIEPANADAMRELGNAYDAAGRTEDAEATFREAARLRPESWAAIRDMGLFFNRHGRLQDALTAFQRVVAIAPDSYAGYGNLGGIYLRLGLHGEAAAALQKSLALRPTSKAYMNLGTIHYFEGRFQEASDAYRKATQLTPSDERAWGALADALRWVPGNSDEVVGAYRQAIALAEQEATRNPNDGELRSRLAMYHAYAGDGDAADRELAEALRLTAHDGTVLFRAGLVHEKLGRRDRALRAIEEALRRGYSREEIGKAPALVGLRQDQRYARIAGIAAARPSSQQSGK